MSERGLSGSPPAVEAAGYSIPYDLRMESAPVSVALGESFSIWLSTEIKPRDDQVMYCLRMEHFSENGTERELPLTGPTRLGYTNGSFAFTGMSFKDPEGNQGAPGSTINNGGQYMPTWPIDFEIWIEGHQDPIGYCRVYVGIKV